MQASALTIITTAFTMLIHGTTATIYQLQDARPYLANSESTPIEWSAGGPAFVTASAGAVRLNFRGAHVYTPSTQMRALDQMSAWTGVACNVSAWALCAADVSRLMPSPSSPPRIPELANTALDGAWGQLGCTDSRGKVLVSLGVYDLSACDILDEGVDTVYTAGRLYHARTAMPLWRYWTCVGLAILLVRTLSYNIHTIWAATEAEPQSQTPSLIASVGLLILVLVDLDHMYITKADQLYFWASVAYAAFYAVLHGAPRVMYFIQKLQTTREPRARRKRVGTPEIPVFNVSVVALQVLATRLYTAAETPYNLLLTGMIACRVWIKVLTVYYGNRHGTHQHHHKLALSLMVDSAYLALSTEIANDGPLELIVAVLAVALALAQLLSHTK